MVSKRTRNAYLMLPNRQWYYRATVSVMAGICIAFLIMSKTGNPTISKMRMHITDTVTPVIAFVARPMDVVYGAGTWISEMVALRQENIHLKNQNIQLLKWQSAAKALESENQALHNLMNVVSAHKAVGFVTARVVSDVGGPYVHSMLLSGGMEDGVRKDLPVITEVGLLGRVIETGQHSSRVLLLNDINSRVPVMAEKAKVKSILVGNNTGLPSLSYLSADTTIQVGDRIKTTGDGGIFPKNIAVGVVSNVEDGIVTVQPFVDPSSTEYVSIVDYTF